MACTHYHMITVDVVTITGRFGNLPVMVVMQSAAHGCMHGLYS